MAFHFIHVSHVWHNIAVISLRMNSVGQMYVTKYDFRSVNCLCIVEWVFVCCHG